MTVMDGDAPTDLTPTMSAEGIGPTAYSDDIIADSDTEHLPAARRRVGLIAAGILAARGLQDGETAMQVRNDLIAATPGMDEATATHFVRDAMDIYGCQSAYGGHS